MKLKTGISTNEDFIKVMKDLGQEVVPGIPAETLRTRLDLVSDETKVTFNSTNETILATVNQDAPTPPVVEVSIDFDISDSIDLLGKVASDLQTGVSESEGNITGTLKYVEDYTGFSGKVEEQSGNYLVLHVDTESEDDVYVEVINGTSGPTKLDEDRIIILRIADKDTQGVKVTTGDLVETYDISGLTCEAKPAENNEEANPNEQ